MATAWTAKQRRAMKANRERRRCMVVSGGGGGCCCFGAGFDCRNVFVCLFVEVETKRVLVGFLYLESSLSQSNESVKLLITGGYS